MPNPTREFRKQFSKFVQEELFPKRRTVLVTSLIRELEKFVLGEINRAEDYLFFVCHRSPIFDHVDLLFVLVPLEHKYALAREILREVQQTLSPPRKDASTRTIKTSSSRKRNTP
jgi:hypothetical protein